VFGGIVAQTVPSVFKINFVASDVDFASQSVEVFIAESKLHYRFVDDYVHCKPSRHVYSHKFGSRISIDDREYVDLGPYPFSVYRTDRTDYTRLSLSFVTTRLNDTKELFFWCLNRLKYAKFKMNP
jgi:hypothetical protein